MHIFRSQVPRPLSFLRGWPCHLLVAVLPRLTSWFIRAAANYQIAIVNLGRAKGHLLAYSDVTVMRGKDEKNLPQIWLEKSVRDGKVVYEGKSAR